MIPAVLDHLWQSTLLAAGAGLLALAFRRARASVRYGLWFAASIKFLIPFAALAGLGQLLSPAVRSPIPAAAAAAFVEQAAQPFSRVHVVQAAALLPHAGLHPDPVLIFLVIWALGCTAVLARWMASWARVRTALRSGTPLALAAPMPVLGSLSLLEPGLVGLWRPALLVPATLFDHLSRPEIDAIIAHETCHFRRRDNLTAAIHMLVEALFWFHPLVWWIGLRLIEEREAACDEAVIRAGHDRKAYARSLVESCRLYLQSPLSCVAGASGSKLEVRVERVMTASPISPLPVSGKILLLAAGLTALATPVAAGWLTSPAGQRAVTRVSAVVWQAAHSPSGAPGPMPAAASLATGAVGQLQPGRPARLALSRYELVLNPQPAPAPGPALDRPDVQEVTMKPLVIASALSLIATAPPAAAQAAAASPDPPLAAQAGDQNQVICRAPQSATAIETRVERRRCLTRATWDKLERLQRANDFPPSAYSAPNSPIYGPPDYVPGPPASAFTYYAPPNPTR